MIIIVVAAALVALSLDLLTFDKVIYYYNLYDLKLITGAVGAGLIMINLIVLRLGLARRGGQRNVRFKTHDGPVSISLNAIETLTRYLLGQLPEIKDMRPSIFANRRGIEVLIKTTLYTNASLPEVTEKIQQYIKARLQETLGQKKSIIVNIQVDKIEKAKEEIQL